MSTTHHTPGPWIVAKSSGFYLNITGPNSQLVASMLEYIPKTGEAEANARLIAAAPDLLAALKEIETMLSEHPEAKQGNSKVHFLMHAARAAIARAETA